MECPGGGKAVDGCDKARMGLRLRQVDIRFGSDYWPAPCGNRAAATEKSIAGTQGT
jgi:hypothetical protein